MLAKIDFHVHSESSFDSDSKVEDIFKTAREKGLLGMAISDHDVFKHREIPAGFEDMVLIPATEYTTDMGHMLVFFHNEDIARGLDRDASGKRVIARQLIARAHEVGALVFMSHPYFPKVERDEDIYSLIDGYEIYNARIVHSQAFFPNKRAKKLAEKYKKSHSAGSDGHFAKEVGTAYWQCEIEGKNPLMEIKQALKEGRGEIFGGAHNPFLVYKSTLMFSKRKRPFYKHLGLTALYTVCLMRMKKPRKFK